MKKKDIAAIACIAAIALTGCSNHKDSASVVSDNIDTTLVMMVGSYSEVGDTALRAYAYTPATGAIRYLYSVPVSNASYFTQAPSGIIYSVSENDASSSSVTALRADRGKNGLTVLNTATTKGESPCYVSVSPDGKYLLTANYNGGNVSVFGLDDDGFIVPDPEILQFSGSGIVADRQEKPHPHCVTFTPDDKYLLVNDLGTDKIHQFKLNLEGESLTPAVASNEVEIKAGSGPRHLVFSDRGDMAYLVNELGDNVTVLKYREGRLSPIQYIAADTVGAQGAADIHLSPDGSKLYVSLRLKNDGIATFDVDSVSGLLTYVGHTPTLAHPRNFTLTPDGTEMLVASRDGNAVQIMDIDGVTGMPHDTGIKLDVNRPVCVKFVDLPIPEAK